MSTEDLEKIECNNTAQWGGRHIGLSIRCEDLSRWAEKWFASNLHSVQEFGKEEHLWSDEAWSLVLCLLEYKLPGSAVYMADIAKGSSPRWRMRTVSPISKKHASGNYTHRVYVDAHARSLVAKSDSTYSSSPCILMLTTPQSLDPTLSPLEKLMKVDDVVRDGGGDDDGRAGDAGRSRKTAKGQPKPLPRGLRLH